MNMISSDKSSPYIICVGYNDENIHYYVSFKQQVVPVSRK